VTDLVNPQLNVTPRRVPSTAVVRAAGVFPDVERVSCVRHTTVSRTEFVVRVVVEAAASVAIKTSVAVVFLVSGAVRAAVPNVGVRASVGGTNHVPLAVLVCKRPACRSVRVAVLVRKRNKWICGRAGVPQRVDLGIAKFAVTSRTRAWFARVSNPVNPGLLAPDIAWFPCDKSSAWVISVKLAVNFNSGASREFDKEHAVL